ncbi:glutamate racemase [Marinomonas posidonica]|uniref:Glutamate racemase n=1 Tax=Marinomonas posidonica (strain CECT 7376 / NCIMB 14433 / IVIA-Po-181) TaxID=491952 RepID=F6D163_MARPP|nr:glutamate racemase [Marinomonas posidonica]AEF54870.1 Glutamate racemase [Marinomonas posidonica IVIA-Po-181]
MKVGVIDSGAGGLTILNAIHKKQAYLDLLYLADDGFAPYGDKTREQLQQRLEAIGQFFEREKVAAIVVACNTATVAAIDTLRATTYLPVIGVEPAVKPAFRLGKQRRVAVLATPVTAQSYRLNQLIELWQADSQVRIMSSASLAYDIDAWPKSQEQIRQTIESLCEQMKLDDVDTLVLACTHYPLVKSYFVEYLGKECDIVEPSEGVSAQLKRRLEAAYPEQMSLAISSSKLGQIDLCTSSSEDKLERLLNWLCQPERVIEKRVVSI